MHTIGRLIQNDLQEFVLRIDHIFKLVEGNSLAMHELCGYFQTQTKRFILEKKATYFRTHYHIKIQLTFTAGFQ